MKLIDEVEFYIGKCNDVIERIFIHKIIANYHVHSETCLPNLAISDVLWYLFGLVGSPTSGADKLR